MFHECTEEASANRTSAPSSFRRREAADGVCERLQAHVERNVSFPEDRDAEEYLWFEMKKTFVLVVLFKKKHNASMKELSNFFSCIKYK